MAMKFDLTHIIGDPNCHTMFAAVIAAYCGLCEGARVPFAEQIMLDEDVLLRLPEMSFVQRMADETFPFRFAGTGLVERIGAEITGIDLMSTVRESERDTFRRNCNAIVDFPCAHFSETKNEEKDGRQSHVESLALPVRTQDSDSVANGFIFTHCVVAKQHGIDRHDGVILMMERMRSEFVDMGFGMPDWNGMTGEPLTLGA